MAPVAKEFEKIIHTARERKKNEALADKIFSSSRRQSLPSKLKAATPGGSLASRVGVKKPQQQQQQQSKASQRRRASVPVGNVDGEWTHDLHGTVNGNTGGSLSSRITRPGAANNANGNNASNKAAKKKTAKLSAALDRMDTDESLQKQVNIIKPKSNGMTIRGLAGPYAIMAQNFAPGTTAADIESAMTPVGGEMVSCRIVKTSPLLLVEMVFSSREGGERVIETFNNKTADGRIIQVFAKPGGYKPEQNGPSTRSTTREQVVDGKNGFSNDLMSTDNSTSSNGNRLFYMDKGGAANKRGRGFQKGRGGR
ncbi:hypothetical protein PT974_10316 [Cladobotryum mycophilum]|uniref:RNA-binding protein n=1 Tax=Cladobotryum mycophilum TaxID=491253 RepID=A0ABR0S9I7_9HYPO